MSRYRCIEADPPWPETGGCNRGADAHYPVQAVEDIPRIMMRSERWRPETSSHLWLWATNTHLAAALWVMERVGYVYKTNWSWVKGDPCGLCHGTGTLEMDSPAVCGRCAGDGIAEDGTVQIGLGQYQRGSHELLLFGTRGRAIVPPVGDRFSSVFVARRTRHSEKPAVAYDIIRKVSPGPRLSMFARGGREGFDVWGNEV